MVLKVLLAQERKLYGVIWMTCVTGACETLNTP